MSDFKDSAIKLFGMTIPLPLNSSFHLNQSPDTHTFQEKSEKKIINDKKEDPCSTTTSSGGNQKPKSSSTETTTSIQKPGAAGEEENETSISQENTSKKPEKILACPRCNSMDTKFCYFNNYNVNQPRHFCKECQRYWTAGGTMRNVPVGAGRRKNKNSIASHHRQILSSESLKTAELLAAFNGPTGTLLTLGLDESDISSEKQETVGKNDHQRFPTHHQLPCFTWPYAWNSSSFSNSGYPVSFSPWNLTPSNKCTYSLGKHSREGNILNNGNRQEFPTLRIDHDPSQAARTSIWESNKKSIFDRDFQSRNVDKIYTAEKSLVLQANPAALSRSLNFHERS